MDKLMVFQYLSHLHSHFLNVYAQLSSGTRGLNFHLSHYVYPYCVCARRQGSDKTGHLTMLV